MPDWQHALRNHLNHAIYASSWAREAMLRGQQDQAIKALASLDAAIIACADELTRMNRQTPLATSPPTQDEETLPDQPGAGQAG